MNLKKSAAERAVEFVEDGMILGLGTGSTAYWAIKKIGERIKEGLRVKAVASSLESENLAKESGIEIISFSEIESIDITIDGADEIDAEYNLIKGGGGALLREKILAFNSKKFFVVVDESKLVNKLGKFPLPVEIVPFATNLTLKHLEKTGCTVQLRRKDSADYITDNKNLIADCQFNKIVNPALLNEQLYAIPGIVETGLFLKTMVFSVVAAYADETIRVFPVNI